MFTRRRIGAAVLAALIAAGAGSASAENVLRWAYQADAPSLDPHGSANAFVISLLGNVYEPLVTMNGDMQLEPGLALKWETVEPTRWRFTLRRGVSFHNGNAFNADDVIFSLERLRDEMSIFRGQLSPVTAIEKVDDHTIDVITAQPNPILPNEWTALYMMDKEWSEENGATRPSSAADNVESYAGRYANGTGPFVVQERESGVKTVFAPHDAWWGETRHNLDRVVFTPIRQDGTRVAALLSGELDMMFPVSLQDIDRIRRNDGTAVLVQPELRTVFLGFDQFRQKGLGADTDTNPFLKAEVRRAVYHAIDAEAIRSKIMAGLSEPAATMISPLLFSRADELSRYPYDPKTARALLAEAGYPDGFSTRLDCPNNRYVNDELICQALVSMMARVGIKVDLNARPMNQYAKDIKRPNQNFAMYFLGITPTSLDSFYVLSNMLATYDKERGRGNINFGQFSNARIDEITGLVESELDMQKRNALILEAYQIVHDQAYYVPLHQQSVVWSVRDGVSVKQRADDGFEFKNVMMQ